MAAPGARGQPPQSIFHSSVASWFDVGSIAATWSTASLARFSGPKDPEGRARPDALCKLLAELPLDETDVFQDEVDISTNPKINSMWKARGQQGTVEASGSNEKRHLSGSPHWRTGQVFLAEGEPKQGRVTALFLAHLDDLQGRLLHYKKIHVICDRAEYHISDKMAIDLHQHRHRDRIELHRLPAYSPDCKPIKRVVARPRVGHSESTLQIDAGAPGSDFRLAGWQEFMPD